MTPPSLWQKLRSARIVQVLVVYLGASWGVLQVTNELQQAVNLPAWVSAAAVILLLVGLLVVLATAWVQAQPGLAERAARDEVPDGWEVGLHELKEAVTQGEVPHLTWARSLLGGVIAFSLLFGFAGLYVVVKDRGRTIGPSPAEAAVAPGVAVLPFTVSGKDLEVWREGMVDLLSTGLDGVGDVRAIDARTVLARWKERVHDGQEADLATALDVARATGARWAVVGNAVAPGSDVRLSADIYDLESGKDLGTTQANGGVADMLPLVDRLSVGLLQTILTDVRPDAVRRLSDVTTTSPGALKAFLLGEAAFRRSDFAGSIPEYERAVAADSGFAFASYRLSEAYGWSESIGSDKALDYLARAERHLDRLPPRQALYVQASSSLENGRLDQINALRTATRKYPDDAELWYILGDTYYHLGTQGLVPDGEARQALEHAVALDPQFAPYRLHLLDFALSSGDSADAARTIAAYDSVAGNTLESRSAHLSLLLAYGDSASRLAASSARDTASTSVLVHVFNAFGAPYGVTPEPAVEVVRLRRSHPDAGATTAYYEAQEDVYTGRYQDAVAHAADPLMPDSWGKSWLYRLHQVGATLPPEAVRMLAVSQDTSLDMDLGNLATGAYAVDTGRKGDVDAAIAWERAESGRRAAAGDSARAALDTGIARALETYRAWRRGGSAEDALRVMRELQPQLTGNEYGWVVNEILRTWMAEMYVQAGQRDEAIRYLRTLELQADAHYRIARLRMEMNQPDSARADLALALHFWEHADPDLPQVRDAQAMLERLGTDRPR